MQSTASLVEGVALFASVKSKFMVEDDVSVEKRAAPRVPKKVSSRFPSFTSNLMTVLGGQAACAAVAFGTQVFYARLLGPVGRGQISLCLMAIAAGALIGGLGGETPLVLWTAKSKNEPAGWLSAVMFWGLFGSGAASCLWALIYWGWHPAFLKGITDLMAVFILVSIPVSTLLGYFMAILTGMERFRLRSGLALLYQLAGLSALLVLVFFYGRKSEMAVLGNLTGILITAIVTGVFIKHFLAHAWNVLPRREELKEAVSLGVRGQLGNLATFLNYRLDVFIVNYLLDPAQVGIYALGVVVSEAVWQIPQAAALALFPRTARTLNEGASQFTCVVLRQVLLVSCVSGVALAVLSPLLVPLIFGAQFAPSVQVIWWILPGTVALSLGKVMSADLAARGKPEFSSIFALCALAVTLVLDVVLIPHLGIRGAALASSAAYLMDTALLALALKRELRVTWGFLFVPSRTEFVSYQQAWLRCKARFWPPALAESNGPGD
jgi:O-antigen/teichoic acid export membrane protein